MKAKEFAWIERLKVAVQREGDKLTEFEKKFCADLFASCGPKTVLSAKQWGVLFAITDKVIS